MSQDAKEVEDGGAGAGASLGAALPGWVLPVAGLACAGLLAGAHLLGWVFPPWLLCALMALLLVAGTFIEGRGRPLTSGRAWAS